MNDGVFTSLPAFHRACFRRSVKDSVAQLRQAMDQINGTLDRLEAASGLPSVENPEYVGTPGSILWTGRAHIFGDEKPHTADAIKEHIEEQRAHLAEGGHMVDHGTDWAGP